ncbi:MAG: methyltransferase domain-containing protein [Acidimicrobiales bacterium]
MSEGAETYTHGHAESVLRSHRWRTVENSAAYLLPHLRAGVDLLDVGCGPGTITIDLAQRVAPGRVLGIDPAVDAIEAAEAAATGAAVANLALTTGDVYALDHADDSFDVVHAHQVLQHLADPVAALREMRRVCRPSGVVAARDSVYRAMSWYPQPPALDRWLEVYCAVAEANGGEPDAGSRLRHWSVEAGFAAVATSASAWCFATDEERAWWGGLWADRITGTALGSRAVELGLASTADLDDMAAAWRSWADAPDGWFAVLHGEVLATP